MHMEHALSIKAKFLVVGGLIAMAAGIWHLLCIIDGPGWYVFARAPKIIVESAIEGTFLAPSSAIVIASLMFACTLYSFSGAGVIKKIPFLKTALVTVSFVCLMRALIVVACLLVSEMDIWEMVASSGWLFVGICFLLGAIERIYEDSASK